MSEFDGHADLLTVGPAPAKVLPLLADGEVHHLPEPYVFADDLREAESRGWVYGLGDCWQITEAGRKVLDGL